MRYININLLQSILIKIMIVRSKVIKIVSSTWLRFCSPFSSQKEKFTFSQSAQRAVWASAIADIICSAKGSDKITDPSLREQLVSLQNSTVNHPILKDKILKMKNQRNVELIFDAKIIDQIFGIFTKGTVLPVNIFQQKMVQDAKQPKSKDTKDNFIFCPNFLVTQEMFQKLIYHETVMLIHGKFGISKTISIILLHYLSSIISNFAYQSFLDKNRKQELNLFISNNLVTQIPKLFYWSMNVDDDEAKLKSLIVAQATELSDTQRQQLLKEMTFEKFIILLRKNYSKKNIRVRVVIDQINVLASIFSKWNNFYFYSQQNQKQWKQYQQKEIKDRQLGQMLRSLMKQLQELGQFESTFYNSSINIEQSLYDVQSSYIKTRTVDIENKHSRIHKFQIYYNENLDTKWGCNDFSHFFWFQIQKRLRRRDSLTQTQITEFKDKFQQRLKDRKWPKHLQFFNIRRMFQTKVTQLQQVYFNLQQSKDLQGCVNLLVNLLTQSSMDDFQDHLLKFFEKADSSSLKQQRIYLFMALMYYAQKSTDHNQDYFFQMYVGVLERIMGIKQIDFFFGDSSEHKQLFSLEYHNNTPSVVKFFWTKSQFITVTKKVFLQSLAPKKIIVPQDERILSQTASALGNMLEGLFRALFIIPKAISIFKYFKERKAFITKDSCSFLQFNKQQSTIESNMRKLIEKAKQNPDKFIFGYPVMQKQIRKNQIIQARGVNSKCFDFVFVSYNSTDDKIEIFTFDITVTSDKSSIQDKIEKAKKFFTEKLQIPNTMTLHHIILCSGKIPFTHQKNQSLNWEILTSSFDQFIVVNSDSTNMNYLYSLRSFNIYREIYERDSGRNKN